MSANSTSRHLRLAVSAAALLLASTHVNGSIAHAGSAGDLDTLIMASLQNSGRSDGSKASKNSEPKTSVGKAAAAKKRVAKKHTKKTSEPSVVQIAPAQGGGGLFAAIGAMSSGSTQAVDAKPVVPSISSGSLESAGDRSSASNGPSVYVTSGYGQSELQNQQSLAVVQQASSFGFGVSSSAVEPLKLDTTQKLASNSKAGKSSKTAPKQIAAAAPPVSEPSTQPSGIGAFLASLGFGESAASPSISETKAESAPLSTSSAGLSSSLKDRTKERSKADVAVTASIGHSSGGAKILNPSSVANDKIASSSAPAPAASVTSSVIASAVEPKSDSSQRSIASGSKSARLEMHAKGGSHDRSKVDVASVASIGTSAARSVSPPTPKPVQPAPSIAAAQSAPARSSAQASSSQSGGLFAALGVGGGSESSPVETTAQIPVAYPEPVVANRSVAMPRREIAISPSDPAYRVDAGDKLRVVVYGQDGLTNSYAIDAGGGITMPLIGRVVARGLTPAALAADITGRLRKGFIREPSVAVEIEAYRPFFILGEVAAPGQYPYVPNMSVEAAVAIAGGFSPRARRDSVTLTHRADGGQYRGSVPLGTSLSPGDTITVGERWF